MHTFVLSDWITVKGNNNSVIQSESDWLDLTPYEDVVFWIDCREASGTPTLAIQTSPTKDETFFGASGASLYSATLASGTVVWKVTIVGRRPHRALPPLAALGRRRVRRDLPHHGLRQRAGDVRRHAVYSFMLSPWITLRAQSSVATITQGEATWLDLRGFEDFVAWLEVKEVTTGDASHHVNLIYQALTEFRSTLSAASENGFPSQSPGHLFPSAAAQE